MTIHNLPHYTTDFVGRLKELHEIQERLQNQDCHLLTLHGAGGVGKTRLAAQSAISQANSFKDGVTFVNLEAINEAELIVIALAEALQYKFYEHVAPQQQILEFLRDKHMLLVLDNFEHLLPHFDFVSRLVHMAHKLKLLVTSREPLNIQEEWLYSVQGLDFPHGNPATGESYDSIQLFASRARRVRGDFSLEQEWKHVSRICQSVEGMPLAIELSATWLKSLSCEAVLKQIESSLDFLVTSMRNVPDRHQSIRAVFDYSWSMLSAQEQQLFMKLSIFRGGFTQESAEKIANANPFTLLGLVEKSFLRRMKSNRFQIHELMRQYGFEKFEPSPENETTRAAHSAHYLGLLEQHAHELKRAQQAQALDTIEADYANIRQAWLFAVGESNDDAISGATESFYWFCMFRGYFQEGISVFEDSLAGNLALPTWSTVRARQISLMANSGVKDNPEWRKDLERCLQISQENQDQVNIGFCLATLGLTEIAKGNYTESIHYYRQSLEAYQQIGDDFYQGRVLRRIGYAYLGAWNIEDAEAPLQKSLTLARHSGDKITQANCLYHLGSIAGLKNDLDRWFSAYQAALSIRREIGDRANTALNLGGISLGFFFRGDLEKAADYANEAMAIATDINHRESKGLALIWLAYLACIQEDYEESQLLFERSIRLVTDDIKSTWGHIGLALIACGRSDFGHARDCLKVALDPMPWISSWYVGVLIATWALILIGEDEEEQGIAMISCLLNHPSEVANFLEEWPSFIRLRAHLKNRLGQDKFTTIWEHGKELELDRLINEMPARFTPRRQDHQPVDSIISNGMRTANSTLDESLTRREHEILILIARGLSNQEIAEQLFIATSTVKRHINNCYGKLAVASRTQAMLTAQKLGLVESTPPTD